MLVVLYSLSWKQSGFILHSDVQFTAPFVTCQLTRCFVHDVKITVGIFFTLLIVARYESFNEQCSDKRGSRVTQQQVKCDLMDNGERCEKKMVWPMKLGNGFHSTSSSWSWHLPATEFSCAVSNWLIITQKHKIHCTALSCQVSYHQAYYIYILYIGFVKGCSTQLLFH